MTSKRKKVTTRTLRKMKVEQSPITMLTAYDYPSAKLADQAGAEMILVGDSLGMVVLGYDSTVPVTLDDMVHHTKAVARGSKHSFICSDLPFLTAHLGREDVLRAAGRLVQEAGAHAVKMEGGIEIIEGIRACIQAGIPVVGHLGLTPQSVHQLGGYRIQGRDLASAREIVANAKLLEEAGICALVLECVPAEVAQEVSATIDVPTIGIGAGRHCDGQVLVYHDLLQYGSDIHPSFVKTYADLGEQAVKGMKQFIEEVRAGVFPGPEHSSHLSEEVVEGLYGAKKEGSAPCTS
ncbi:3-methyl-2-oxobutanoate hydroxymethyltransferase [Mechercharimyces sp. CAU 1602]|uniref:3-methyl-2-oxobutanoate hydroxymethyltransferase n=1 Tax=Mechercharimyces sp. CAU 1602 TaxID=2973933 RepID=UPI002162CED5|nr:3-methyl-2-oxobutanoate hydroxymethyltransferase [Mechercharimyces sp. CAU 1602]MCS1351014.1 3-methyl-2-oxobutanoate hydroxymethyltransferase [Mechercharimyces sp. CAU 1602]